MDEIKSRMGRGRLSHERRSYRNSPSAVNERTFRLSTGVSE